MIEGTFLYTTLRRLCDSGEIDRGASTLVVCGGQMDADCLRAVGFTEVTISNLDESRSGEVYAPYRWSHQDAESLSFEDESFDLVMVHAGLHHCRSPHRGLLELYRVARRGVLVVEARDSLTLRIAARLRLAPEYELEAVVDEGFQTGGVRNSAVPNYVYRWTEREVRKTLASFEPCCPVDVEFFYGYRLPLERLEINKSAWLRLSVATFGMVAGVFFAVLPRQGNCFAFFVRKPQIPEKLWPWLIQTGEGFGVNRAWSDARYRSRRPTSATTGHDVPGHVKQEGSAGSNPRNE